jgi:hypothetical protein
MVDGVYKFNQARLVQNHRDNLLLVMGDMLAGDNVAVDNTNTTYWEMRPYILLALVAKYKICIKAVHCDIEECIRRNTHGVSAEVIRAQKSRFQSNQEISSLIQLEFGVNVETEDVFN